MKFLLFGTGDYYQRYKKWFLNHEVLALIDNSLNKIGTYIDGILVVSPKEISLYDYDYIVILSFQFDDMKKQLLELKVLEEKIYHFYTLHKLIDWRESPKEVIRYNYNQNVYTGSRQVLLLTQELTVGGPGLALLQLGLSLRKHFCDITVASMIDGPLRERLKREQIDTIIDSNMQLSTMLEEPWVEKYDLIICNTLNFHVFLSERNKKIPCVWWLHDAEFFYAGADKKLIRDLDLDNLYIYSVGSIPRKAIKKINPALEIKDLLYSVDDVATKILPNNESGEIIFVMIGFLEYIKGHDILVEAIKQKYEKISGKIKFVIIGHDDTLYGNEIKNECKSMKEISFIGVIGRKEIHQYLENADALVCPSRQDSMPTVVAEAMSHSTACIISDVIGTAEFLEDKVNCLKFPTEDAERLGEILVWSICNRESLKTIGKESRKIYEELFSVESFEKNVAGIIDEIWGY